MVTVPPQVCPAGGAWRAGIFENFQKSEWIEYILGKQVQYLARSRMLHSYIKRLTPWRGCSRCARMPAATTQCGPRTPWPRSSAPPGGSRQRGLAAGHKLRRVRAASRVLPMPEPHHGVQPELHQDVRTGNAGQAGSTEHGEHGEEHVQEKINSHVQETCKYNLTISKLLIVSLTFSCRRDLWLQFQTDNLCRRLWGGNRSEDKAWADEAAAWFDHQVRGERMGISDSAVSNVQYSYYAQIDKVCGLWNFH